MSGKYGRTHSAVQESRGVIEGSNYRPLTRGLDESTCRFNFGTHRARWKIHCAQFCDGDSLERMLCR